MKEKLKGKDLAMQKEKLGIKFLWSGFFIVGTIFLVLPSSVSAQYACCDESGVIRGRGDDLGACINLCEGVAGYSCLTEQLCNARAESAGEFADDVVEPSGEVLEFEPRVVTPSRGPRGGLALPNPLGTTDPTVILGRLIRILIFASGFLSLLMFIYAGFTFLTASGNPEKIKKGKDLMLWVIVGLTVTFSSYLVLRYIIQALVTGVVVPD